MNLHLSQIVQFLEVSTLGRLLGGGLALVASPNSLRIAFNNHGLERWHLLLVAGLVDVGRGRIDAVDHALVVGLGGVGLLSLCLGLQVLIAILGGALLCDLMGLLSFNSFFLILNVIVYHRLTSRRLGLLLLEHGFGLLILEDHLLERVGVVAELLVVREHHTQGLGLLSRNLTHFLLLGVTVCLLLQSEFLDTVRDLELLVAELVLSQVLVARDHGVELEGALIRGLEVAEEILHVDAVGLLVRAILSLLGLATRR